MKWIVAAVAGTCGFGCAAAAQPAQPKLIVAISIDQFSSDLYKEYRPHFTGGLKRLSGGIVYANGYQAHAATETCPGHSTILTGGHPARTGIAANNWMDFAAPRADKAVYCAEDERVPGTDSRDYSVSAVHLRVPALGDRLKAADPRSRVVAVAAKDRSAVMMGGHRPDQRWWWKDGRFVQNGPAPAAVAAAVNASVAQAIALARPPLAPPAYCTPKDRAVEVAPGRSVGTFRFDRKAGDAAGFAAGPEIDAATLAMAAALVRQMQLGKGPATDLLAVGLSATDYVGHRYGPGGLEMCLQLTSLDRDLADFFEFLDGAGVGYAVVLTADHGGLDIPERLRPAGVAGAERIDPAILPDAVSARVSADLELTGPVFVGDFYLAPTVPPARRGEALALARKLLTAHRQVEGVYPAEEIAARPIPVGRPESWSVLDRLRASFDPQRSPTLSVVYKSHVMPIPAPAGGYVATHGSVWDYDRKVPILFWWNGIAPEDRSESAMTVDILPTLAGLIGLGIAPQDVDGQCLALVKAPENNCRK